MARYKEIRKELELEGSVHSSRRLAMLVCAIFDICDELSITIGMCVVTS